MRPKASVGLTSAGSLRVVRCHVESTAARVVSYNSRGSRPGALWNVPTFHAVLRKLLYSFICRLCHSGVVMALTTVPAQSDRNDLPYLCKPWNRCLSSPIKLIYINHTIPHCNVGLWILKYNNKMWEFPPPKKKLFNVPKMSSHG